MDDIKFSRISRPVKFVDVPKPVEFDKVDETEKRSNGMEDVHSLTGHIREALRSSRDIILRIPVNEITEVATKAADEFITARLEARGFWLKGEIKRFEDGGDMVYLQTRR